MACLGGDLSLVFLRGSMLVDNDNQNLQYEVVLVAGIHERSFGAAEFRRIFVPRQQNSEESLFQKKRTLVPTSEMFFAMLLCTYDMYLQ